MLEIPICCTVCCSPWELKWWVIGVGISQKAFQSLWEIGEDWNYHSIFLKKEKEKGRRDSTKQNLSLIYSKRMCNSQNTSSAHCWWQSGCHFSKYFLCFIPVRAKGHKYREKQKEFWKKLLLQSHYKSGQFRSWMNSWTPQHLLWSWEQRWRGWVHSS